MRSTSLHRAAVGLATGSLIAALGTVVSVLSAPVAHADSLSGNKDCTNKGTIVVAATYWSIAGVQVSVKQAGPPNSPTWGAGVPGNPAHSVLTTQTWFTPIKTGRWTHYSSHPSSAKITCSRGRVATGPRHAEKAGAAVVHLGDKVCTGGKKVGIYADHPTKRTVSWMANQTDRTRISVVNTQPGLIWDVHTGDSSVYDIIVRFENSAGENPPAGKYCE